jgi:hypothetical protein
MENPMMAHQAVTVYPARYYRFKMVCFIVIFALILLGFDGFVCWQFWTNNGIDAGAFISAAMAIILTMLVLVFAWGAVLSWSQWDRDRAMIMADSRGLSIDVQPLVGKYLIPWEEIEWIAVRKISIHTYLCINLRSASRWWAMYGNGKPRRFQRASTTGAQINVPQAFLSLPARQILLQIEQNYAEELKRNYVSVRLF